MLSDIPIAEGQLIALFMQSIAYGVHLVTFVICVSTLLDRPNGRLHLMSSAYGPWLLIAIALFVVGTIDVSFTFYHSLVAFIFYTGQGGAARVFDDISNWVNVMKSVCYFLGGLISDAALMYRCWAVWNRGWSVLVLPIFMWMATLADVGVYLFLICTLHESTTIPTAGKLRVTLLCYLSITMTFNLITTGLIVWRIWRVKKRSSQFFQRSWRGSGRLDLSAINTIFVESALLYTTSVVITLITSVLGNNLSYGFSDISLEMSGICFDMIIIRISKGLAAEQTQAFAETSPSPPTEVELTRSSTKSDQLVSGYTGIMDSHARNGAGASDTEAGRSWISAESRR